MIEKSSVLKLRGLPFEATENDIINFFKGFQLLHVHLCRNNGKTTGEAYVQLSNDSEGYRARAKLDKKCLGKRYIEIFPAKQLEMKKRRTWESQITGFVVRMRGLPFNACQYDVKDFFKGIEMCQNRDSLYMTFDANRRPTGEAFVEFPSEKAREEALKRDRKMIGHRYIELFPATKADVDRAVSQNRYNMQQGQSFLQGFLRNAGVPQQVNDLCSQSSIGVGQNFCIADALKGLSLDNSSISSTVQYDNGPYSPYSGGSHTNIASENSIDHFTIPAYNPPLQRTASQVQDAFLPINRTNSNNMPDAFVPISQQLPPLHCIPSNDLGAQLPSDLTNALSLSEQDQFVNYGLEGFEPLSLLDIEESLEAIEKQEKILKQQLLQHQLSQELPHQLMAAPNVGPNKMYTNLNNMYDMQMNMQMPFHGKMNKSQSVPAQNNLFNNNYYDGGLTQNRQHSFGPIIPEPNNTHHQGTLIHPTGTDSPKRFVSRDISLNNLLSFQSAAPFTPYP